MKLDELKKIIKEELKSILKENKNVEIKYLRIQKTTRLNKQNGEIEIINNMFIYPDPNGKYTEEEYLSLEKRKGMDKFKVTICKDKKEAEEKAAALKENAPEKEKEAPPKEKPGTTPKRRGFDKPEPGVNPKPKASLKETEKNLVNKITARFLKSKK